MPEYEIKRIGAEDFSILVPLMKDCFGMEVNINYFHWKYIDNPAGHFIGFIAIEPVSKEIGAYYGVIPQRFIIDGMEQTVYQSCDTMTHSKHRRLGLFKMLALECFRFLKEENKLFIIGFGGAQSTPGFIKFGWKHIFDFRYYFKPALLCKLSLSRSFKDDHFAEVKDTGVLKSFLKSLPNPAAINAPGNAEHIRWRTRNPNYDYHIISYNGHAGIEGYAIYYIQKSKMILFDFAFGTKKAEKALLWYLSKSVVKNNFKGIISFCQEAGTQSRILKRNWFIINPFKKGPLSEKTPFIFFAPEMAMNKFSSPLNWQITSYDHDAL